MSEIIHTPVLLQEVIDGLSVRARGRYIDATLGFGGHTRGILDAAKGTSVLGIERDPEVARQAKLALRSYGDRVKVVTSSYEQLSEVATATDEHTYDGIVFDLGYSSWHVDESGKGFSFRKDEPLDMRYNPKETSETAGDIINTWNEEELFHIFATFGEERTSASRRIARAIVQARKGGRNKIRTTGELVGIIEQEVAHRKHKIHPATLIFQALRIVVNDELGTLQRTLPQTLDVIKPGGKIAIISFHSLEDRIVKRFFAYFDTTQLWVMTKRPITPTGREIETNPRARSAKLRIAQRV